MLTVKDFVKEFQSMSPGDLIVVDTDEYDLSDHYLNMLSFGISGDDYYWEFEFADAEDNMLTIRCEPKEDEHEWKCPYCDASGKAYGWKGAQQEQVEHLETEHSTDKFPAGAESGDLINKV